jgi:flagellar protein FliJ
VKQFAFSLAAILRLREHREWERELELGKATSRCAAIESDIRAITDDYQHTVAAAGGDRAIDIEYRMWQTAYLTFLDRRRAESRAALAKAEEERAEIKDRYLEAMRDRKVLSRLRERQEVVYRHAQVMHEGKVLDDMTNARSARARSGAVKTGKTGNEQREATSDGTI